MLELYTLSKSITNIFFLANLAKQTLYKHSFNPVPRII